MKKVIRKEELRKKINEAINLLCDTVKETLGPEGNNSIINNSSLAPFITNDGVTIAKNIESEDPIINTILELAKESSIKTDEEVGDGTTTTLVLLQSILAKMYHLKTTSSKILLKNKLQEEMERVIFLIKGLSHKPSLKEKTYLASSVAGDEKIGKLVSEVYEKVGVKEAIQITTTKNLETKVNYFKGYIFETMLASDYFFRTQNKIELNNCYLIVTNNYLSDIETLSGVLNEVIQTKKNLVVVASDYSEDFINNILSLNMDEELNIYLLKNPEYGLKQLSLISDLCAISSSQELKEKYTPATLGLTDKITITKENVIISYPSTINLKPHILELEKSLSSITDSFDYSHTKKRLSMLNNGLAIIEVGGNTITEIREKKMRFDDALCAISSLEEGVVPGAGVTLLKISSTLSADSILKEALKEPFKQILRNASEDEEKIEQEIIKSAYTNLYNSSTREYENILTTKILDSTMVLIKALTNACSIATLLFTTESLIINEYDQKLLPNNEYNI